MPVMPTHCSFSAIMKSSFGKTGLQIKTTAIQFVIQLVNTLYNCFREIVFHISP